MNDKILTVVVPTYNAENYLRDNLNAFIYEDILPDVEILIINDGSKDKSLDIAGMEYVRNVIRIVLMRLQKKMGAMGQVSTVVFRMLQAGILKWW
ncbi:MAG: glycosyltransferase family 2 protein [Enterocloster clostridioformis]